MRARVGKSDVVTRALSAAQAEPQQPKVCCEQLASFLRNPLGSQGYIERGFVLQGTSNSLLTVLSNSSDFLPYAVVASALLAL